MTDLVRTEWKAVPPETTGLKHWLIATADAEPQMMMEDIRVWPAVAQVLDGQIARHLVWLHNEWLASEDAYIVRAGALRLKDS